MAITQIYAGVEQVDVASLTTGGVTYRCAVWLGGFTADGAQRVEAKISVEGEDGQRVHVDGAVVASAVRTFVDCPRVLAVGSRFVVHWIDSLVPADVVSDSDLYRSIFDVTAISTGWSNQGAIATHTTNQYDHATVDIGADEFVVCHRTAAGAITTLRYSAPFSWVDIAWTTAVAGLTIADTVLAVTADESDDDAVVFVYQDTLTIQAYRMDATTGANGAAGGEVFADVLDGDMWCTAVGLARAGTNQVAVVAELLRDVDDAAGTVHRRYQRLVATRLIRASTAAPLHESQWCVNLHLLSKPWAAPGGSTGTTKIYAWVGFKSIADGQEWDQSYADVVDLDIASFPAANASGVVRPIPMAAVMGGSIDARPHAYTPCGTPLTVAIGTRLNHLSAPSGPAQYALGPHLKRITVGCVRWGRLKQSQDGDATRELQPVEAGVGLLHYDHEPAWAVRRSLSLPLAEPAQPDTPAWRGASVPMLQPVETPPGLVLAGGITACYDGQSLVELGFLWTPEIVLASPVGAGGAMDVEEDYYWFVNLVWPDGRGGIHRGPPSRPVAAHIVVNGYCTLTIRCLNLGMKDDTSRYPMTSPIGIEVWRTYTASGSLVTAGSGDLQTYLFRSEYGGSIAGWTLQDTPQNDPANFTISIDVGRANSVVSENELAPYQLNLSTLQWTPPPPIPHQPLGAACVWQNRLFGIDPETGALVWSEEMLPVGSRWEWPYFLDTNRFELHGIGKCVALAPIENDLGLLTRDGVFTIAGDPGAGGSGNTFIMRTIAKGIGCIEPRSVTTITDGITFQSAKGRLHVFTRGSGFEDIGGPIEDQIAAGGNVRSAVFLEDGDEVRFGLQATPGTGPLEVRSRVAVYNLRSKVWTTRVLPAAAQSSTASRLNENMHATAWRGRQGDTIHAVLEQGGLLLERSFTDTAYSDVGAAATSAVLLDVTTEWIHMGVDTTKRVWEVKIVTERINAGPLTIEYWADIDGTWDADEGAATQTLTVASPAPDTIRFRPRPSKVRGFKLRIYEPNGAPSTENLRLVALVIDYGLEAKSQGIRNTA